MQGHIINSYLYCKRKAWLAYHRINLEENSEDVIIGKSLHEINKNSEIEIEDIKVDSITSEYVIEIKNLILI